MESPEAGAPREFHCATAGSERIERSNPAIRTRRASMAGEPHDGSRPRKLFKLDTAHDPEQELSGSALSTLDLPPRFSTELSRFSRRVRCPKLFRFARIGD